MNAYDSLLVLFSDVTKGLEDKVSFGHGAADDFDSQKNRKYPYVWVDPMNGGFSRADQAIGNEIEWEVTIRFLTLDAKTSNEKETQKRWSSMFSLMENWVHKLDREFLNNTEDVRVNSDAITIIPGQFRPVKKATKDFVSGWALPLTVKTLSNFDYCSIYE